MSNDPSPQSPNSEEAKRLLADVPFIRAACALDLLVFLHRHPRTFLTNEQLALFVGYDIKQVARATEAFIVAGLLKRTQNPAHAARLYFLGLSGQKGGDLTALLKLASTRPGRREVLQLLRHEQTKTPHQSREKSDG